MPNINQQIVTVLQDCSAAGTGAEAVEQMLLVCSQRAAGVLKPEFLQCASPRRVVLQTTPLVLTDPRPITQPLHALQWVGASLTAALGASSVHEVP